MDRSDLSEVERIEEYARRQREARREAVSKKLGAGFPDFLVDIRSTEVAVTLEPQMIPLNQIDASLLHERLKSGYQLRLKGEKEIAEMRGMGYDAQPITELAILNLMIHKAKSSSGSVKYGDGRLPLKQSSPFIEIGRIEINREVILANVTGHTEYAELVVREVFETLWSSVGIEKSWDSDETQRNIQQKRFGTSTLVDLGFDLIKLLRQDLASWLEDNTVGGCELGPAMMARSSNDSLGPRTDVVTRLAADEIHLRFSSFDMRTGYPEASFVRVIVPTKDLYGMGKVIVTSEMPLDKHFELVQGIITACS